MTGRLTYTNVSFGYPDGPRALEGVDLTVEAGSVLLVVGSSGSGKSTLLRCANGLIPHASGGRFGGEVVVGGRSTRAFHPRDLADVVGFVHQDPEAQFVVDRVESDIAFGLENLGIDPIAMRRRVEEILDALGVAPLRDRNPATLSGGERQRCAIAGALVTAPSVLVLDEPTSQLDPQGAEDVLAAVARLNAELGTTVMIAEHRLERTAPIADLAVLVEDGRVTPPAPTAAVLATYPGAPAVTALGRRLGWDPPPLTVRDARRFARDDNRFPLDRRLATSTTDATSTTTATSFAGEPGEVLLRTEHLSVRLGHQAILDSIDVEVRAGEAIAVLGRNGAGKTTLLRALGGLVDLDRGRVVSAVTRAYVPQDPSSLLFRATVRAEVAETLRLLDRPDPAAIEHWLDALGLHGVADRHPRSLSGGERQRVAIAAVAVGNARILLLDEPTRGMDAASRAALERAISGHCRTGGAVVLASHDVELAARCAHRAIVIGDGEVVADGTARDVLGGSLFGPQVARVLPGFLTVDDVARVLTPLP